MPWALPPDSTMALEVLVMSETDEITGVFDWEERPAVRMASRTAFVSNDGGVTWVEANFGAMAESATPMSSANFAKSFPRADLSKVPGTMPAKDHKDRYRMRHHA